MRTPTAAMSSPATHPQPWYWNRDHVEIVVGGMGDSPPSNTPSHNPPRCSFPPLRKSAAELRCNDMVRVHNAEVKRNRDCEAALRDRVGEHQKTCKRLRSEREQLRDQNKRLREQLAKARPSPNQVPPARPASAPAGNARKQLLELIRQTHPDKASKALDRTKITQGLTDVLEML